MLSAVQYEAVDDQGLHIKVKGKPMLLPVDHVVLCHGQEAARALFDAAAANDTSKKYFVVGGAEKASEIDARRAIDQATRLMVRIETANTGDVFQEPVPFSAKLYEFANRILA
jgi:2,4-dienoyl-CoA reductase (NADPH2)